MSRAQESAPKLLMQLLSLNRKVQVVALCRFLLFSVVLFSEPQAESAMPNPRRLLADYRMVQLERSPVEARPSELCLRLR